MSLAQHVHSKRVSTDFGQQNSEYFQAEDCAWKTDGKTSTTITNLKKGDFLSLELISPNRFYVTIFDGTTQCGKEYQPDWGK